MKFEEFINEAMDIPSSPELQTPAIKKDAREIISKIKGLAIGRTVTDAGDPKGAAAPNVDPSDVESLSMVLKNNAMEAVLGHKDQNDNIYITLINKQKITKRTITINAKATQFLRRLINS